MTPLTIAMLLAFISGINLAINRKVNTWVSGFAAGGIMYQLAKLF